MTVLNYPWFPVHVNIYKAFNLMLIIIYLNYWDIKKGSSNIWLAKWNLSQRQLYLIDILICVIIRMLENNFCRICQPILHMKIMYFREHFSSSNNDVYMSLDLFVSLHFFFFLSRTKCEKNYMIKVHFSVTWGPTSRYYWFVTS